jgi:FeS assembly SUF system protein
METNDTQSAAEQPAAEQELLSPIDRDVIKNRVIDAIKTCYDPEIPVNIYDLGLVYDVAVNEHGATLVTMTLTSPHCPAAQSLPSEVQAKVVGVKGVTAGRVEVTWTPTWNTTMMSDVAKLTLGFM